MKTCATCIFWRKLGDCDTVRHVHYSTRYVEVPAGPEGQCRALPPAQDNRWPSTTGGDWCGFHAERPENLTEATTPAPTNGTAAGGTREPATDSEDRTSPAGGKGTPPVKPAPAAKPERVPSLFDHVPGFRRKK